jgi:fluoroquinolone transport system permease protein
VSRFWSSVRLDLRLQYRHGFYFAAAFVTLVWIAFLFVLPPEVLPIAVPLIIFVDLAVVGFYFIAVLVLYDKTEATLFALVATPLRFREYLASKVLTLTLLALVLALVVAMVAVGLRFNLLMMVLGVILTSLIASLVGFISISPFSSFSDYLIPSGLVLAVLGLPLLHFTGWMASPLFYLIPTQGSLMMLGAAFAPLAPWQLLYALFYQVLWIGILSIVARRAFDRHVLARNGSS